MSRNADRKIWVRAGVEEEAAVPEFAGNGDSLLQVNRYGFASFVSEEDCLRAVLCWNACRGVSNEDLRRLAVSRGHISTMKTMVGDVARDELFDALVRLMEAMPRPVDINPVAPAFQHALTILTKYRKT